MLIQAKKSTLLVAVVLSILVGVWLGIYAGNLDPPAAPAPTETAIDETDPRTAIRASDLPLTISTPGSYHLAEDINSPAGGITITASDVTLDLMGFTLSGTTGDGISADPGTERVTVMNGTVLDWLGNGVDLNAGSRVVNVLVANTSGFGIRVTVDSVVTGCISNDNRFDGISTGVASTISDSVATGNGDRGIVALGGTTIRNCETRLNDENGITALTDSVVIACTAVSNGETGIRISGRAVDCVSRFNGQGISANAGSTVSGCSVGSNTGDGIVVGGDAYILNNVCEGNGNLGDGAGILVTSLSCRIEGNHVVDNDRGIDVDAAGNVIIRNSATANTVNYDIVVGNDVGPIGTAALATSPWANISN